MLSEVITIIVINNIAWIMKRLPPLICKEGADYESEA